MSNFVIDYCVQLKSGHAYMQLEREIQTWTRVSFNNSDCILLLYCTSSNQHGKSWRLIDECDLLHPGILYHSCLNSQFGLLAVIKALHPYILHSIPSNFLYVFCPCFYFIVDWIALETSNFILLLSILCFFYGMEYYTIRQRIIFYTLSLLLSYKDTYRL